MYSLPTHVVHGLMRYFSTESVRPCARFFFSLLLLIIMDTHTHITESVQITISTCSQLKQSTTLCFLYRFFDLNLIQTNPESVQ